MRSSPTYLKYDEVDIVLDQDFSVLSDFPLDQRFILLLHKKIIYQLGVLLILYISSIESRVWKRQNLGEVGWFCKYSRNLLVCIRLGLGDAPSHHGSVFFGNLGKKNVHALLTNHGKAMDRKKTPRGAWSQHLFSNVTSSLVDLLRCKPTTLQHS